MADKPKPVKDENGQVFLRKACGDCGADMVLRTSRDGALFYGCTRFPVCRGAHGAHPDGSPKGIPADQETRRARIDAHGAFDSLWLNAPDLYPGLTVRNYRRILNMARTRAYHWLSEKLGMAFNDTHIGGFNAEQCERVVAVCAGKSAADVRAWWKSKSVKSKKRRSRFLS